MNNLKAILGHAGPAHLFITVLLFLAAQCAHGLTLADSPLFLTSPAPPNILLMVDDSGSMDSEVLMPTNDGALWWHTGDQSFVGRNQADALEAGRINYNSAGTANATWKKYVYLFPNGVATGSRVYGDATDDHFAVPPLPKFAFTRSPAYNPAYFDPATKYDPWVAYGTTFPDATPTAAKSDPSPARGTATFDLTSDIKSSAANRTFKVHSGMSIPAGTEYWNGSAWVKAASPISITATADYGINYFPATFYLPSGTALPSGYGYTGTPLVGNAPDGSPLDGYEIKPANFASASAYDAAIGNFANWFTYYRKRHAATRGGIGAAFKDITAVRAGSFKINSLPATVTMKDFTIGADRDAFFTNIYDTYVGSGGTPNKQALKHAGEQYERTDAAAPILYACQRNATILFTDGFSTVWTGAGVGNSDDGMGSPYEDAVSDTIADIAMNYYKNNLRPTFTTGKVPVKSGCTEASPDPRLDCNRNLHMNTYGVTLGTRGVLFDPDVPVDPYISPPAWPTVFPTRHPSAVDDLWHATVNGRGTLLNAKKPAEVGEQLKSILTSFLEGISSASSVATNSTQLETDTKIYQARFDSRDWSGEFLAYPILTSPPAPPADAGKLGTLAWDAGLLIPAHASRTVTSYKPGTGGIPFLWASLDSTQQALLNVDPFPVATVDTLGDERVDYLRGSDALEVKKSGTFRNRSRPLGDIINSDPFFVGSESFGNQKLPGTEGSTYAAHLSVKASKPEMVYVGANDGMLHGFDAETGVERLAHVPNAVFPNLNTLTDPLYTHRYFVDGSPKAADAYFAGAWHTVLVEPLAGGGRAVFALDITDPTAHAPSKVLWEYTDTDLGYPLGEASIVRMANGEWAAVFGNGYLSDNDRAVLYVVNIETGALIRKIDTGAGDASSQNGLAAPTVVDTNNDRIADAAYAGDLMGNMWKFDLSGATVASWDVAYKTGVTNRPLFVTEAPDGTMQAITAKPAVGRHPGGGVVVLFGTGKYMEPSDRIVPSPAQVQTFYGLHDDGTRITGGRSALKEQKVVAEVSAFGFDLRLTTDYEPGPSDRGWFMDLPTLGERQISRPVLRGGRIIFTTLIPNTEMCGNGGTSWLMEVDAITGSRLDETPFDLNGDGKFNSADWVFGTGDFDGDGTPETIKVPVSGKKSKEGIIKTPAIIGAGEKEYKYASGTSGNVEITVEPGSEGQGRQSWRQLQ